VNFKMVKPLPIFFLFCAVVIFFTFFHHISKPLYHCRILVREKCTCCSVHLCNLFHIFISKSKIKNIEILNHSLFMNRFWNDDHTSLNLPAQHYLSSCFAIFFTDFFQYLVFKKTFSSFTKRSPCLQTDIVFICPFF